MPELPETETIARDLHAMVCGTTILGLEVIKADILREASAADMAAALTGLGIARVWRRAKLIVLDMRHAMADEGDAPWRIVVQPRFTGGLIVDAGSLSPADRAYDALTNAIEAGTDDPRGYYFRGLAALVEAVPGGRCDQFRHPVHVICLRGGAYPGVLLGHL